MNNQELGAYKIKHGLTNRALARLLGIEECQAFRWLKNKHKISRAWQALIDSKLEEMDAKIAIRDAVEKERKK